MQAGFQAQRLEALDSGPAISKPTLAYAAAPGGGSGGVVSAAAGGDRIVLTSNKLASTSKDIRTLVIPSEPHSVGHTVGTARKKPALHAGTPCAPHPLGSLCQQQPFGWPYRYYSRRSSGR